MADDKERARRPLMREGTKEGLIISALTCFGCLVMFLYIYIFFRMAGLLQ